MTNKELYEKYKGAIVIDTVSIKEGIICGYTYNTPTTLIMAITKGEGWSIRDDEDIIIPHIDNKLGYWYVDVVDGINIIDTL